MPSFEPKPLPGFESAPILTEADITAMSEQIAANALAKHLGIEDKTSEVREDIGYVTTVHHVPVEDEDHPRRKPENIASAKAASERRRRRFRNRESERTGAGADLAPPNPPRVGVNQETAVAGSRNVINGLGQIAAERAVATIEVLNIMKKSGGDTVLGRALLRAHQEKPRS